MQPGLAVVFLTAAALAGCGPGPSTNDATAKGERAPLPNAAAGAEAPVAATPAWLAGRWQSEGLGDCGASDSFLAFESDGTYAFMQERGRWALEGDRLTITVTEAAPDGELKAGDRSVTQVRAAGPDEAEITPANAPPSRIHRCRN